MSTTDGTRDTLRRAQLAQTAETLRMAANALEAKRDAPDDPLGDVAAYVRSVRADCDALEALGYRDDPINLPTPPQVREGLREHYQTHSLDTDGELL